MRCVYCDGLEEVENHGVWEPCRFCCPLTFDPKKVKPAMDAAIRAVRRFVRTR